jgi:hypothetical protein
MAILTSDNLPLSRVTKSNLQSTANGHPVHAVTGGPYSGVELRPIFPAKVQLTANCLRTSAVGVQSTAMGVRITEHGGEDWRYVLSPGMSVYGVASNLATPFATKVKAGLSPS